MSSETGAGVAMEIVINAVDYSGSIADGPGIRTVLFLQGCERMCEDCHNPGTWDVNAGERISVDVLVKDLKAKSPNRKLTISGGEPLLQTEAVVELLKALDQFNIALYTGYNLEDVPPELLGYLNYIKVGEYDKNKHCTTVDYIGSTNQRFINLRKVEG